MRELVRPEIIESIQESFSGHNARDNPQQDKRIKFLNQFYLFNGMSKFFQHELRLDKEGIYPLEPSMKQEYADSVALINSNLDHRQSELMKVFNCNPEWPLCLYDFTVKNKSVQFLAMKCKRNLSQYVVDDYFQASGKISKKHKRNIKEEDTDIVREQNFHLCCCQNSKSNEERDKVYKFVRNFKILFIKGDEFLFRNKNLKFMLDSDIDI